MLLIVSMMSIVSGFRLLYESDAGANVLGLFFGFIGGFFFGAFLL